MWKLLYGTLFIVITLIGLTAFSVAVGKVQPLPEVLSYQPAWLPGTRLPTNAECDEFDMAPGYVVCRYDDQGHQLRLWVASQSNIIVYTSLETVDLEVGEVLAGMPKQQVYTLMLTNKTYAVLWTDRGMFVNVNRKRFNFHDRIQMLAYQANAVTVHQETAFHCPDTC